MVDKKDLKSPNLTPRARACYALLCTLFLELHISRDEAYSAMEALMHDSALEIEDIKAAINSDIPMVPGSGTVN